MGKIRDLISEDLKAAMKARDEVKTSALRMLKAEILKEEVGGRELDENGFLRVVKTMKNQREESISEFAKGGRQDLVEKEKKELAVIALYLPSQLSAEELEALVDAAIAEAGATDAKAMGQVMKIAVAKAAGRADGKAISALVKARLSK